MADIDFDNLQDVTPANLLKAVNVAIAKVTLGGQSYTINGRTFTRANLPELKKMRDDLSREVAESSSGTGGLIALAKFGNTQ